MPFQTNWLAGRTAIRGSLLLCGFTIGTLLFAQEPKPAEPQSEPAPINAPSAPIGAESPQPTEVKSPEVETQKKAALEITISEPIEITDPPFYYGGGFSAFGAIGGLIGSQVYKNEPTRIAAYVKQENIKIDLLLKNEFERQFNGYSPAVAAFKKNQGQFKLIVLYGITSVPFSKYRPYLSVRAQFTDATGKILWKDREWVGANGKANCIPYPDFFKSAKDFQAEFEVAANEVVLLLLSDFQRKF